MKAKHLLVPIVIPLTRRMLRKTNEKARIGVSNVLHHCLLAREESLSKEENGILTKKTADFSSRVTADKN
jgi:hypothetical protein